MLGSLPPWNEVAVLAPALRGERKPAHTQTVGLENDDAPFGEIDLYRWHVREEERDLLLGSSLGSASEEDDGGESLPAMRKQRPEVGVGRDEHTVFFFCALEDLLVAGGLHAVVANVDRVVAGVLKPLGDGRRQGLVDQEPQPAAASGSSRSRTASAA